MSSAGLTPNAKLTGEGKHSLTESSEQSERG